MTRPSFPPTDHQASRRRLLLLGAASIAGVAGCGGGDDAPPAAEAVQATWAAAPRDYNGATLPFFPPPVATFFENQTLRQVVRVSAGGSSLRVKLSNRFGTAPLALESVHVALSQSGGRIDAASDTALKFTGQDRVVIPAGQEAWSDFVTFSVPDGVDLALSIFLLSRTQKATYHEVALHTSYGGAGNLVSATTIAGTGLGEYQWLTEIDVRRSTGRGVIVAYGDSITDGFTSTVDAAKTYPDALARRVAADTGLKGLGVVNAGISGNRVLNDVVGPSGQSRFERDVLGVTGVSHVIVLQGLNDLGFSAFFPTQSVSTDQVTAGLKSLVDQARARGFKVYLGTLTPFNGFAFYSPEREAQRQVINAWVRANSAAATGVIDFDAALRDPQSPTSLRSAYDSGDHAHPSDAGYQAMADAIDLSLFR